MTKDDIYYKLLFKCFCKYKHLKINYQREILTHTCMDKNNIVYTEEKDNGIPLEEVKPYLRTISNDTITDYEKTILGSFHPDTDYRDVYHYDDFCGEHYLDNDRLISKRIAIEAPKDMYKEAESL